jgi:hypothetical protein
MRTLWIAADPVAAALCTSPVMEPHAWVLAHWREADAPDHVRQVIRESHVGSTYEANPLLMGFVVAGRAEGDAMASQPEGARWLDGAQAVAVGFGRLLEWLRAQMPRYPSLLVPQVDSSSNRSLPAGFFFGPGKPWMIPFRREAPQLRGSPDFSPLNLPDGGAELSERVRALSDALKQTPQWSRLVSASASLTDADLEELKALRRHYRREVTDEHLDAVEPHNLMRRHAFREAALAEVLAEAKGRPDEYLQAFTGVDELLSALARVVEHLVVFGPPHKIGSVVAGVWRRAPFGQRVRLVTDRDSRFMFGPKLLEVRSEVPALGGVVLGERSKVNLADLMTSYSASTEGLLLPNSSHTLSAGPAW